MKNNKIKKEKKQYKYVSDPVSGRLNTEQAQRYGEEIERLSNEKGEKLTSIDILNSAEASNSPLNDYFTWDNIKAGIQYRKHEATQLLREICITIITKSGKAIQQRAFVCVNRNSKQPNYVKLDVAMNDEGYKKEIITRIKNHLQNTIKLLDIFESYS